MLRWSQRARTDLKSIHDRIAQDSPRNAKAVTHEFLTRAEQLLATPHMGRIVPELDKPDIREISVRSWRVIYQLRADDEVFILTVIHKRRMPVPGQLRG